MKILVTSTLNTPFIHSDINLLRRHYDVRHLLTRGVLSIPSIFAAVNGADLIITWFASVYAYGVLQATRRAGKRMIIIVGGVDAARMPEIGYGIWLNPWKAALVARAVRGAWRVCVVDESLGERLRILAGYDGGNIRLLPTGYDGNAWIPGKVRDPVVVTVAAVEDRPRLLAKGVDRFLACAKRLPEVTFLCVGIGERLRTELLPQIPPNVRLRPPVPRDELRGLFARTSVYCQLSRSEGLPNSLCEAMLCGCIPVGTDAGGIPRAIGDAGYVISGGETEQAVAAIRSALRADGAGREAARRRIIENFPIEKREAGLLGLIGEGLP